eukprot:15471725-Alexandrium_andersonii.AAC.1
MPQQIRGPSPQPHPRPPGGRQPDQGGEEGEGCPRASPQRGRQGGPPRGGAPPPQPGRQLRQGWLHTGGWCPAGPP